MPKKKFTDEMKAVFMTAVHEYMAKGWSAGSAYKQVAAEYQQEGKEVPEKNTCYNWLAREKRESANLDGPDGSSFAKATEDMQRGNRSEDPRGTDVENAETEEAARYPEDGAETEAEPEAEDTTEAAPELDPPSPKLLRTSDYTHRLELMVRLYRRRFERDIDAVCDRLLPELAEEE